MKFAATLIAAVLFAGLNVGMEAAAVVDQVMQRVVVI